MGLLFLKQVKTGMAYAESTFWQDSDSDSALLISGEPGKRRFS